MSQSQSVLASFVGQAVRKRRLEMSISQQQLAEKCGLDRSYITLIEQGKKNPTLNIIEKLGDHLSLSSAHFLADVANEMQIAGATKK